MGQVCVLWAEVILLKEAQKHRESLQSIETLRSSPEERAVPLMVAS